ATATAPFAIYHFQKFAAYGLAANLAAVPIMTLWIMPLGLVALLAMPFGLETWPLALMGWGIDTMLDVAAWIAALPAAHLLIPRIETWGLALVAAGGLWLCLWRGNWRWWGLPAVLTGLASCATAPVPDILLTGDGRLAAVRTAKGDFVLSSTRRARYAARRWLDRFGQPAARLWTETPKTGPPPVRCEAEGCLFRHKGKLIAFSARSESFAEDCARADVLITPLARPPNCSNPRLIVDGPALRARGAHAIWLGAAIPRVVTDREHRGIRPWVPHATERTGRLPRRTYRRTQHQNWRIKPTSRP
ncbi:MAG: ComEC/Rec2 family competence protein, partial [Bauldia litoralis]